MKRRTLLRTLAAGGGGSVWLLAGCGSGGLLSDIVDATLGLLGLYRQATAFTPGGLLIDAALLLFGELVAAETPLSLSFNRNHGVIFQALSGDSPLTVSGTYTAGDAAGQMRITLEGPTRSFTVNSVSEGDNLRWTWAADAPALAGEGTIAAESRVIWTR
ncbi:MAG: hypothetical protein IT204_19905 [Fimbriimonadaceae bacterium]|nr:hypothetical protein [Fimbriimonadaceae bacterium]